MFKKILIYENTNVVYAVPQYGQRVIQEPFTGGNCY